ncbi:MAG TPA: MASE3 domain-containing protein [Syntrophales bacterium]|nr:MASE3 domain-containing protein [Syntrophales bacterium]
MDRASKQTVAPSGTLVEVLSCTVVLVGLYLISLHNYLLFHSLAELFSVSIGVSLFILAWNSRRIFENNYLLFIGVAYLSVSLLTLFHTLSYKGMGVFVAGDVNLPTQLWIASRFVLSISLLTAPYFLRHRLNPTAAFLSFAAVTAILLCSIFIWKIFPPCYVEGAGLTPFKVFSEYVISFILLVSLILLYHNRRHFDDIVLKLVAASILLAIGSELAFTFYISVYGLSNLIGHLLELLSFYLIYKAIIETGFAKPYRFLFRSVIQQQEALRESEKRYHALFEGMTEGFALHEIICDGNGNPCDYRFLDINPAFERLTGLKREDVIGNCKSKVLPNDDPHWLATYGAVALTGSPIHFDNYSSALKKHYDVFAYCPVPGQFATLFMDITDRKLAEERIRSMAKFPAENPYPVLRLNHEGKIMYANERSNAVLRNWQCEVGCYAPAFWRDLVRDTLRCQSQKTVEVDYGECVYSFIIAPVIDAGYVNLYGRDVTERNKAEMALKERTEQLENANRELESFSYSISHDLRAPLRAIDGYSRMILKNLKNGFDEDIKEKFTVIRSNAQMMGQLIDDLLAFSRLNRKEIAMARLDMDGLIRDAWKELQVINPGRNMQFKINGLPYCQGDRLLIKQVCLNLLSNSIKFTKFEKEAHIEVGSSAKGNEVEYYVKDNGIGFDMAYYDKLFGVFQRLHSTDDFEGTGVGLAIVQRIIHRHEGRVWAESNIDQGACFYFTLPIKE